MKRYKRAAWLMIIHGGCMEIGGVLCAIPALILGSDKFDIGQYFSSKLPYFQENLYLILFSHYVIFYTYDTYRNERRINK